MYFLASLYFHKLDLESYRGAYVLPFSLAYEQSQKSHCIDATYTDAGWSVAWKTFLKPCNVMDFWERRLNNSWLHRAIFQGRTSNISRWATVLNMWDSLKWFSYNGSAFCILQTGDVLSFVSIKYNTFPVQMCKNICRVFLFLPNREV